MVALWKTLRKHRDEFGQKFTTSLHRITRWAVVDEVRQRKKWSRETPVLDVQTDHAESLGHLAECLVLIKDPAQASLLRRRFIDGVKIEDLAREQRRSRATVQKELLSALRTLKRCSRRERTTLGVSLKATQQEDEAWQSLRK